MVPDIAVLFNLDGEERRLDYRRLPLNAWSELKRQPGFTPRTLLSGVEEFDVEAIVALLWLEQKVTNRRLTYSEVAQKVGSDTEFELVDILIKGRSLVDDEPADVEEGGDDDPPTNSSS